MNYGRNIVSERIETIQGTSIGAILFEVCGITIDTRFTLFI
jgi:hypothetical protein